MIPKKLQNKLEARKTDNALRTLGVPNNLIDFSSNDYLGFAKNETIFANAHHYLTQNNTINNGATGSRLLSGNYNLYNEVEAQLCETHNSEAALLFNSGYTANLGFFSCVPQRGDIIFYDEFAHASIRDGILMSNAKAYKFKHNTIAHLKQQIEKQDLSNSTVYIVTESIFSMDGDSPDIIALSNLAKQNNFHLIVDEAHAIGVFGDKGYGATQNLNTAIFTRIITFGKAIGCHGAAILCSKALKSYLVNFSRPFIYTTGLPPHALATIKFAYTELKTTLALKKLKQNILFFKTETERLQLKTNFIESHSAIQCYVTPGNSKVKAISAYFKENNFSVKPILSPTVAKGEERLRFCLHAYNTETEITKVLELLVDFKKALT